MLLAINSGNTNCVFAVFEGETMRGAWRAATNYKRTADEYAVWLTQLMALEGLTREILTIQAEGNYANARALGDTGVVRPVIQQALSRLTNIPVDIEPRFTTAAQLPR